MEQKRKGRVSAISGHKRDLILEAARRVFEHDGLDGASLRAIALEAGYTPAALYFHFDSKEAIYGALLETSLGELGKAIAAASAATHLAETRFRDAALAFFQFYAQNPRDLDLGFYLFRGGMKPAGLGRARDEGLNAALTLALRPIAEAAAALGAPPEQADLAMVDTFAHATGLLLLAHTGRMRMFNTSAETLMRTYIDTKIRTLKAIA